MAHDELETIHSDQDWLDLRAGEGARVTGRLDAPVRLGATALLIALPDWSLLAIELADDLGAATEIAAGTQVELVVTRTEDGLETSFSAITIRAGE